MLSQQVIPNPWPALPAQMAPLMRQEIPDLAAEMVREISRQVAEYDRPGDAEYRHTIQRGVEMALHEFVGRVSQRGDTVDTAAEVHRAIGRAERKAGRSLDALHAAYRVGARLSWRRWARISTAAGIPTAQIYRIADAVFAHIDELAEHAAEGYATVAGGASDRSRHRSRLLHLLLGAEPASKATLADAARAARWSPPEQIAALALETPILYGPELPIEVLASRDGTLVAPAGLPTDWLPASVLAVVGPTVPLNQARDSVQLARRCLALVRRGLIPRGGRIVRAEDHLATLILLENEAYARMLIDQHLTPLQALTPRQQQRMVETLLAALSSRAGAPAVAELLDLHPQTVRYRLRRAEALFGDRLRVPGRRLEFEMALRSHQLLNAPRSADLPTEDEPE